MEPAVDVCRLGVFALFVVLGLLAAAPHNAAGRRRRVDVLLTYVLVVSGLVGLLQQESWPFTQWALVSGLAPQRGRSLEVEALDAAGRGYIVDLRVLQPLSPEEFASWLHANQARLAPSGEASLARFLLSRAEQGRQRLRRGERVAPNDWLLGPLAAPYHFHDAKTWRVRSQVPETPFTGLRAFFVEWDVEQRLQHPGLTSRRLVLEHHEHSS
jgi:hypothetical protein